MEHCRVMHTGIVEYVVFEARCLSFFFGGSVGTDMVVPRSVAMAAVTSSLWMAIVYRGGSRIRFFSLVSFILSLKLLFRINEGDRDGQNCHNYSQWKPGVLGLHPCAEGDENDGKVGWNSNKDDTNWFCFDFEFHSLNVDIRRWA